MIRKKGPSSYQVWVYNPVTKSKEYQGTRPTHTEAKHFERECEGRMATVATGEETVAEFALRWVKEYPRPKASTRALYDSLANRIANDQDAIREGNRLVILANLKMRHVSRPVARAYVIRRPNLHGPLRAMFNDAVKDGLVATNPFSNLGLRKSRGRRDIKTLTEAEVADLADGALYVHGEYGPTFRAMILFSGYTGLRPGEVFALDWQDVDVAGREVHVNWRLDRQGGRDLPKGNVTRIVALLPPAIEALASIPRPVGGGPVFLTKLGHEFRQPRLLDYWGDVRARFEARLPEARRLELDEARNRERCQCAEPVHRGHRCQRCNLAKRKVGMDYYELRHFCATMLLERGLTAEDVAEHLGHQDGGELVRMRYGHPSKAAARDRLRAAFTEPVPTPIRAVDEEARSA